MAQLKKVGTTGNVNDVEITQDNTQEILESLEDAMTKIMTIIGIKAERYAKKLCPVGTPESTGWTDKKGVRHPNKGYRGGTLRNSITFEVQGNAEKATLIIGSNVEYAPYVELGTGPYFTPPPEWEHFEVPPSKGIGKAYVHARPYLRPAIENHLSEYKNIIRSELENI